MRLNLKNWRKNAPPYEPPNRGVGWFVGSAGSAPSAWRDPRYRPPGPRGVTFHVLSSAEAALGAGFDLERIGLRAVRGSAPSL